MLQHLLKLLLSNLTLELSIWHMLTDIIRNSFIVSDMGLLLIYYITKCAFMRTRKKILVGISTWRNQDFLQKLCMYVYKNFYKCYSSYSISTLPSLTYLLNRSKEDLQSNLKTEKPYRQNISMNDFLLQLYLLFIPIYFPYFHFTFTIMLLN